MQEERLQEERQEKRPSRTIQRVVKGELCSGCGLCASVGGAAMRAVPPGYNRPQPLPQVTAEQERMLAESCPGARVAPWQEAPHVHPYWGPYHRVATGWATDEDIRHRASSGGGLTGLLVFALEAGLVDRVVHIGADPDLPTRNRVVVSRSRDGVVAGAGSRYAASSPLEEISRMLDEGGRIAFVGKPCDVGALRQFGRFDSRVAVHVPYILSFFCAGIPSQTGADRILAELGVAPEELREFRFRGFGWPGLATAVAHDGRTAEMTYERSWGHHLSREVQFRCKICPDAVGGVADVACADAWYGGETGYPTFEEQAGRSLMMTRTAAGEALLEQAMAAGAIATEPLDLAEIDLMQPSQARRKRLIRARVGATRATLQPAPRMDGLMVGEAAARADAREALQNFAGTARRIVQGRR
jgi:coenzyme F420 hydrogenase subunit beta